MAPVLARSLSRLNRESLVKLCLEWSQSRYSKPYLASNRNLLESDEEDYLHEPAEDTLELRLLYEDIRKDTTGRDALSKRDIIDRIVDGDWRRGLSLHQLATIDFAYLEQNDAALRWTALKLVPLRLKEDESVHPAKRRKPSHPRPDHPLYPETTPAKFLESLRAQISPLVKAHYTLHRLTSSSNLSILRMYIVPDTPFAPSKSSIPKSPREATDSARIMYIALPDSCPYIYVSISGSTGSKTLSDPVGATKPKVDITTIKRIVLEAIPKALSRSQERWALESTKLTTKSLKSISLLRGNERPGTGGGAYSQFSEEYTLPSREAQEQQSKINPKPKYQSAHAPPLHIQLPTPPPEETSSHEHKVRTRFGPMQGPTHAALNRFTIKLTNILTPPPSIVSSTNPSTSNPHSQPKKRKRLSLEEIENGVAQPIQPTQPDPHPSPPNPSSNPDSNPRPKPASLALTFNGTDIFAGIKELALLSGGRYIDLDKMPAWCTGEKGVSSLVV